MNWPPVFHLQWLGHVPHIRQHLPSTIAWNSPTRELIGSVMVSSLLLPTFGTLFLPLYFWLPLTFLPSKGRSITTFGTRWHDFLITVYRYFINLFYSLQSLSFPFLEGCRLEKGQHIGLLISIKNRFSPTFEFSIIFSSPDVFKLSRGENRKIFRRKQIFFFLVVNVCKNSSQSVQGYSRRRGRQTLFGDKNFALYI